MGRVFEESAVESWLARYGFEVSRLPDLGPYMFHRSVRQFRAKPIPESTLAGLMGAAQSAATSSNLQLWSVISVQDPERREAMAKLCGDQQQIRDAAWFLAFLIDHHRLAEAALEAGQDPAGLDYVEFFLMAAVDAALAAERMVCAAESLGIGSCYIGALRNNPAGVRDLLQLPPQTFGVFGLCLGWPSTQSPPAIKPRLRQDAVWFRETYGNPSEGVAEYNTRMTEFYESQQMKGEVTWSMRSGRRVDGQHMTGREVLREFLESQGFNRR